MTPPLLELRHVCRDFPAGEGIVAVLKDVTVEIHAGESVAIVGASGSGKSTLMNILGCLDRPTSGDYQVAGRSTALMSADELAALRREHFGFIFQRYHLLGDLSALANVEVPAIYAGVTRQARDERARILLRRLGLGDRLYHRPGQLSGGQQQRVSIARALMNGGQVILADEPTGALDSHTGEEVLKILTQLHLDGHATIVVTHDRAVAEHADRIIEIRDGEIVSDHGNTNVHHRHTVLKPEATSLARRWQVLRDRFVEAFRMATLALVTHRLRTFLTMLSIMIGIASVVSVVALGNGSRQQILSQIRSLGTNTLDVFPGRGEGDTRASHIQTLQASDARLLASQSYVDSATPRVSSSLAVRYGSVEVNAQVEGVGDEYFHVRGMTLVEGALFDRAAIRRIDQSVVMDEDARAGLFGAHAVSAIGKVILVGKVPCRVIGIIKSRAADRLGSNMLTVWVPYSTLMDRVLGQSYVSQITVRVVDNTPMAAAADAVTKLLTLRHGRQDFYIRNTAEIRATIEATTRMLTLLIGSIAAISLIVGGIGVMNIMLVSVTERTQEIGVRMAVGGRQSDILQQFLIEAVLVCLVGGALGVLLAATLGVVVKVVGAEYVRMMFSTTSIVTAFIFSSGIGVAFGFLPARNAARLDPIVALARE